MFKLSVNYIPKYVSTKKHFSPGSNKISAIGFMIEKEIRSLLKGKLCNVGINTTFRLGQTITES